MFDVPPKCPALADKISGLFGWRHTYRVHHKQKGIPQHMSYMKKSYSLTLPRRTATTLNTTTITTTNGSNNSVTAITANNIPDSSSDKNVNFYSSIPIITTTTSSLDLTRTSWSFSANQDSGVVVHHLQTQSGILDPDDRVNDVADDREQILASFEDPGIQQGGGDGASGSSIGTNSPDIFRAGSSTRINDPKYITVTDTDNTPHIEVTGTNQISNSSGSCGLQVRRSSDPSLHQISDSRMDDVRNHMKYQHQQQPPQQPHPHHHQQQQDPTKRWSAAPVCRSGSTIAGGGIDINSNGFIDIDGGIGDDEIDILTNEYSKSNIEYLSPNWDQHTNESHNNNNNNNTTDLLQISPTQFSRSGRLSMQFLGGTGDPTSANSYKWIDAADRAVTAYNSKSLPRDTTKRKEPLGQAYESIREKNGDMLLIVNEYGGPLGLSAVPDIKNGGLLVQYVEPDGRADMGRLRAGDRILEINGIKLIGLSEASVQDHLRRNCTAPELRLRVIRAGANATGGNNLVVNRLKRELSEMIEADEKNIISITKIATVSPTRKVPGVTVGGSTKSLQTANTRKLGKKIEIALRKGQHGLGFSVTTRDNPAGGHCPIYIKTILPRGAAIEDGRLRPGDRLLEVDGIGMTGKTQSEVVAILRATQSGATVKIVVSRQQDLNDMDREMGFSENEDDNTVPPKPPAPILPQKSLKSFKQSHEYPVNNNQHFIEAGTESTSSNESAQISSLRNREILTFHIPVHDTEKAGLGVSVKGKTGSSNITSSSSLLLNDSNSSAKQHDGDLGIFVKSVLNGGAASRDGRLKTNDQLLNVNGISLLGQLNAEAMETLRKAMLHTGGKYPGMISLTVSRRLLRSNSINNNNSSTSSNIHDESYDSNKSTSSTSEQSGKTVIYLTPDKNEAPHKLPVIVGMRSNNNIQNNNQNISNNNNLFINNNNNNCINDTPNTNRWSNPVLDRLTGGTGHLQSVPNNQRTPNGLRNDSYYMATNDCWSPTVLINGNNSVLIEEDPEPMSPHSATSSASSLTTISSVKLSTTTSGTTTAIQSSSASTVASSIITSTTSTTTTSPSVCDITYSSQLSLETNPPIDAFSRDAIGRRSMSEKHHAALDAKETGTYQRNKKLREEREKRIHNKHLSGGGLTVTVAGSMESLASVGRANMLTSAELNAEALDRVGDLGPSLGLKKSSSLESLQTMVQEIQMADEPRGPIGLRAPRGRGREDSLRAAVERPSENKPRKHWLLEDISAGGSSGGPNDTEGGFINRNGPLQSSLNEGKQPKPRNKKPGLLKGIGHMFRFGKHRKDSIIPTETLSDIGSNSRLHQQHKHSQHYLQQHQQQQQQHYSQSQPHPHSQQQQQHHHHQQQSIQKIALQQAHSLNDRDRQLTSGPPMYQPPPPPSINGHSSNENIFHHRYSHYVNYEELQQQINRRHQHYHSQRSNRSNLESQNQRPASNYYEYETVQYNSTNRKLHPPTIPPSTSSPSPKWIPNQHNNNNNNSNSISNNINSNSNNLNVRNRGGPFITQVTIRDHHQQQNHHILHGQQQPPPPLPPTTASKV